METASSSRVVRILDVDPDLGADLEPNVFAVARDSILCPLVVLPAGTWNTKDLAGHPAVRGRLFGCIITEGMSVRELLLAGRVCSNLLGPGDLVPVDDGAVGSLPMVTRHEAPSGISVALLDDRFLVACRRWPRVAARMMDLAAGQIERTSAHQAISQLPRVEDRLLALFWHLADRWAQVSADGVVIRLPLTHEALGRLIGARRPTVSLGLRLLTEQGTLARREDGSWLLDADSLGVLETKDVPRRRAILAASAVPTPVPVAADAKAPPIHDRDALKGRVAKLREQLETDRARVAQNIARNRQVRQRLHALRLARNSDETPQTPAAA